MTRSDPAPHDIPATVTGRLGLDDMACHVPVRFRVPPGVAALAIDFGYTPGGPEGGAIPHQLSISVIGPAGPRGTRHNSADQSVRIGAGAASPGYLPGPVEPGIWTVEIDCHRILPPGRIDWRITVAEGAPPFAEAPAPGAAPARQEGPGWFRGDLHRHTDHSDAVWSPEAMVADARARGYDFAALTDHNTVSALPAARRAAGGDLLVLPGMELTTFHGHALALGSGAMHDWRIRDGQTMAARAADIAAAGDLFVIAHPMSAGHPFCTGCFWAYPDVMPGPARLVEVWNGRWGPGPKNPLALDLFHGWLNRGHRLVATAGSDDHGRFAPGARPGHVLVHAGALTPEGLVAGLRAGHVVLTSGPGLSVAAGAAHPGDVLAGPADLDIAWEGAGPGALLRVVTGRRGDDHVREAMAQPVPSEGALRLPAGALGDAAWVMVELRGEGGAMEALANPVFFGDWPA